MTTIYPSPIFGPVKSRRLGVSLGINLLPEDGKVCTFDCIYCECGFNAERRPTKPMPTRSQVSEALEQQLIRMKAEGVLPDVLTFAGNGEPTCHPDFEAIIDDTIHLRDEYCPSAKVSVLSNSTRIVRDDVFRALQRVDNNILKLDTIAHEYINKVDRPTSPSYDVDRIIARMKEFEGHVIIQTMFMHGTFDGADVSNLSEDFILPWLDAVKEIAPQQVMIYTIDRETPAPTLSKATPSELDAIRDRVIAMGIPCSASY